MQVDGLPLGALETNCWIVSDDEGGPAIVIDPADDASAILRCLGERPVEFIVVTHAHFDHVGAARDLVAETGAPLAAHAADAAHLTSADGTGGTPFGFHVTAPAAESHARGWRGLLGGAALLHGAPHARTHTGRHLAAHHRLKWQPCASVLG